MDAIFYYLPFLETIRDFFELGGPVLNVIAIVTLIMWMLIIERIVYFRTGHRKLVRNAHNYWDDRGDYTSWNAHQIRTRIISQVSANAERNMALIKTCVALCPLLGLLGTVTGMISVFDALATQGGNARSMAAGVSQATIPTMSGMIAAISGVLGSTLIKRKVDFETELFEDHLTMDH